MFRSILSGDDVVEAKPHPEIYRRSVDAIGLEAQECLVVEDAIAGVEAARAAGIAVVGLAGICSREALRNAGACHVIVDLADLLALLGVMAAPVDRTWWTAIIPAAGRGSRLGYSRPKILFPLAGKLVLDWLLELLAPNCQSLVFVLSPEGAADVTAELDRRIPKQFDVDHEVVIQETPTGMGDAVALALPAVRTRNAAVLWGDQVGLRRESVEACMALHQGVLQPELTFPTVMRANPYICFERDAAGRLTGLKQARERDVMPATGESDSGFFCFKTASLSALLAQLRVSGDRAAVGGVTGEFNLLPVIPLAAREGPVLTPRLSCVEEAIGINDSRDAAAAEEFLVGLHGR